MMLIALCSAKGAPGVSTAAVGLGMRWPHGEPVVVECDPTGGDLAARFGLRPVPGLVSLAAAARRDPDPALIGQHSQFLPGGLRVVPGPVAADQARAALRVLAAREPHVLRSAGNLVNAAVIVDVGRIDLASPALPVVRGADAVLLLARPLVDELSHVATLLAAVPTWTRTPGLVLVGSGYPVRDVERELGIPVMAVLPNDPRAAKALTGQSSGGSGHGKSALGKALARLAHHLVYGTRALPQSLRPVAPPQRDVATRNGLVTATTTSTLNETTPR
jgi:hypothetical protein